MKQGSTLFLRGVVGLIGLIVLGICIFGLPGLIASEMAPGADFDYGYLFFGLYIPAIPFFFSLYQALKLLGYIDDDKAFTQVAVNAFRKIKLSALAISGLFLLGMPYIFYLGDKDDAPGVVAIALVIIFASCVIATFAAVLQKLIQSAVDIKSENDLTV